MSFSVPCPFRTCFSFNRLRLTSFVLFLAQKAFYRLQLRVAEPTQVIGSTFEPADSGLQIERFCAPRRTYVGMLLFAASAAVVTYLQKLHSVITDGVAGHLSYAHVGER